MASKTISGKSALETATLNGIAVVSFASLALVAVVSVMLFVQNVTSPLTVETFGVAAFSVLAFVGSAVIGKFVWEAIKGL